MSLISAPSASDNYDDTSLINSNALSSSSSSLPKLTGSEDKDPWRRAFLLFLDKNRLLREYVEKNLGKAQWLDLVKCVTLWMDEQGNTALDLISRDLTNLDLEKGHQQKASIPPTGGNGPPPSSSNDPFYQGDKKKKSDDSSSSSSSTTSSSSSSTASSSSKDRKDKTTTEVKPEPTAGTDYFSLAGDLTQTVVDEAHKEMLWIKKILAIPADGRKNITDRVNSCRKIYAFLFQTLSEELKKIVEANRAAIPEGCSYLLWDFLIKRFNSSDIDVVGGLWENLIASRMDAGESFEVYKAKVDVAVLKLSDVKEAVTPKLYATLLLGRLTPEYANICRALKFSPLLKDPNNIEWIEVTLKISEDERVSKSQNQGDGAYNVSMAARKTKKTSGLTKYLSDSKPPAEGCYCCGENHRYWDCYCKKANCKGPRARLKRQGKTGSHPQPGRSMTTRETEGETDEFDMTPLEVGEYKQEYNYANSARGKSSKKLKFKEAEEAKKAEAEEGEAEEAEDEDAGVEAPKKNRIPRKEETELQKQLKALNPPRKEGKPFPDPPAPELQTALRNNSWGIDSMCSHHVTGNKSLFYGRPLTRLNHEVNIELADGSKIQVFMKGSIHLHVKKEGADKSITIEIKDVYYSERFLLNYK